MWKHKRRRTKTILKKKNKGRELKPLDFKTYHKATVINTVWHRKNKWICRSMEHNIDSRNRALYTLPIDFQQIHSSKEKGYSVQQMGLNHWTSLLKPNRLLSFPCTISKN
jgi:hypothetical protein